MTGKVKSLVKKSRESASLAVNVYNNPAAIFKTSGFIVLMNIAWTSLFHAIFERDKTRYFYKDPKDRRRYIRIDGEPKTWELSKCSSEYFKDGNNATYQNIQFFVGIRNKIEHRFVPQIDPLIFGECQSYLINFEEMLVKEFGAKYALADSLFFALQYSRIKTEEQIKAVRSVQSRHFREVKDYVDSFRRNLDTSILSNPSYSFRVFLIPKPANRLKTADAAVEFVKYDPAKPEEMDKYEHLVAIIKEKAVPSKKSRKTVVIAAKPSEAKEKVLLVDRGYTGKEDSIGITRDPTKASGVLVVEKLSDEIFNDVYGLVDAAMILHRKFGELPSKCAQYYVYAGREKIEKDEVAELFLRANYYNYAPFYCWLLKVSKKTAINFIKETLNEKKYPNVFAFFRLFLAIENNEWLSYVADIASQFSNYSQKPTWCWSFENMCQKREKSSWLYATTGLSLEKKNIQPKSSESNRESRIS
jgi:hypothetical protein